MSGSSSFNIRSLESGFFLIYKSLFDHPVIGTEKPLSRLEAWLWMLSEACRKEDGREILRDFGGKSRLIFEPYGSLTHSSRFMAEAFGWSQKRVRTFLISLENSGMIVTKQTQQITQVNICNFLIYQNPSRARGLSRDSAETQQGLSKDSAETQTLTRKHENTSTRKQNAILSRYRSDPDFDQLFGKFLSLREDLKKPLDGELVDLFAAELERISGGNVETAIAIIRNSLINQYPGIYPVSNPTKPKQQPTDSGSRRAEIARMIDGAKENRSDLDDPF